MAGQVVEPWQLWREVWAWGGPDAISRNKVGVVNLCTDSMLYESEQQVWLCGGQAAVESGVRWGKGQLSIAGSRLVHLLQKLT
jgi:hypothetical protein